MLCLCFVCWPVGLFICLFIGLVCLLGDRRRLPTRKKSVAAVSAPKVTPSSLIVQRLATVSREQKAWLNVAAAAAAVAVAASAGVAVAAVRAGHRVQKYTHFFPLRSARPVGIPIYRRAVQARRSYRQPISFEETTTNTLFSVVRMGAHIEMRDICICVSVVVRSFPSPITPEFHS